MVLANIVHSLDTGGAERLVVDMSLEFAREHDVVVICLDRIGTWGEVLRAKGVPVYLLRRQPGLDVFLAVRLARLFRELSVDIVHAHQTAPWFYSALSRYFYRPPKLLFEEHGRHYPEPDKPVRRLVNRLFIAPKTDLTVAVSEDIRQRLVCYEGLREDAITVVYNGAHSSQRPTEDAIGALRQQFGFTRDDFIVGFVGRLDPIKNIPMLIESIARIRASRPSVKCLVVGGGGEMQRLQGQAAALGLSEEIVFAGFREDVSDLVYAMDTFVLPSFSEGTSMALLEAMSAGVPVIATRVGGNIELIRDGISGYLVDSDSVDELSGAIEMIAAAEDAGADLAAAALKDFEARFSFSSMIEAYSETYERLRAGNGRRMGSEVGS